MKGKNLKEAVSIEKLAHMTQKGFAAVDEKFAEIRREMATKSELRETEEHLLDVIRGIEVRRPEFEAVQSRNCPRATRRVATVGAIPFIFE